MMKSTGGVLTPADHESAEVMQKVSDGGTIILEYKPKRNYQFHKKMFALLKLILSNTDKYENMTDLLTEMKLKAGHYQEHITTKGNVIYVPKSIAFDEMDEAEFSQLYSKFIDIAMKDFVKMNRVEIEKELIRFV